ncbi:MAG TPA: phytoene/squalene synthase family protein [Verrucomicrobiae bacterium]|nr:phytoene/squalene synthase family protein [Verrucomicrobiae bacterium]
MGDSGPGLLTDLLKQVSRSFYLTLRILPAAIRPQIGLAYLLARTTDTIADTQIVPVADRLLALQALRHRILGHHSTPLNLAAFAHHQASPAEWMLLERAEEALSSLAELSAEDRQRIRDVLSTITTGQELDLQRFAGAAAERIVSLNTDAELDDYTYRVAGCVGEFWTRMCRAHLFSEADLDDDFLLVNSIRFGKGLQLVNILRDLPADLRQGRCYLPEDRLWVAGLAPFELLQPANGPRLRLLYDRYLDQAERHLAAGWAYTNTLPRAQKRLRLACAWPILIGARTIDKLRDGNVLAPELRVKVSRAEVRGIILRTLLFHPWPAAWNRLFPQPVEAPGNEVDSDADLR